MTPSETSLNNFYTSDRAHDLLRDLDTELVPQHVAIIMDGNGRWATKRGLPRLAGHNAGAKAIRETIGAAIELGIGVLTIYSFSSENWSRPADEVSGLMNLFVEVLSKELRNLKKMGVRVRVAGSMEGVPAATAEAFRRTEQETADFSTLTLVVALNYGGRLELIHAVKEIAQAARDGSIAVEDIDDQVVADHLYTAGLPDPDLVIRTSGEMRVSNFLLWQIAYSELLVTDELWPDFNRDSLLEAVIEFQNRDRRFGGQ